MNVSVSSKCHVSNCLLFVVMSIIHSGTKRLCSGRRLRYNRNRIVTITLWSSAIDWQQQNRTKLKHKGKCNISTSYESFKPPDKQRLRISIPWDFCFKTSVSWECISSSSSAVEFQEKLKNSFPVLEIVVADDLVRTIWSRRKFLTTTRS